MTLFIETERPRIQNGQFTFKAQTTPEVEFSRNSVTPPAPTIWQEGASTLQTGSNYDGWAAADDVAERTYDLIQAAVDENELDSSLDYACDTVDSGSYGTQQVIVIANTTADTQTPLTIDGTLTAHGARTHETLRKIAESWNWSKSEPGAATEQMYVTSIRVGS